jgi:hypothetical protein
MRQAMTDIRDTQLGTVYETIGQFAVMSDAQRMHCALWVAGTHVFRMFPAFARLDLAATGPGCGKTTTLEVLLSMCPQPLVVGHSTQSSLKNWLDEYPDTTLGIDERDMIFGTTGRGVRNVKELSSMLNSGYAANGKMLATRNGKAVQIPVYNPVALAGIGRLDGALFDRSITITLEKGMPATTWVSVLYESQLHAIGKDLNDWLNSRDSREFLAAQPYIANVPGDPRHKLIMACMAAIAELAGIGPEFRDAETEIVSGISAKPPRTRAEMLIDDLAAVWPATVPVASAETFRAWLPNWPIGPGHVGDVWLAGLLRSAGIESVTTNGVRGYRRSDVITDSENSETEQRTQNSETLDSARAAEAFALLEN